MNRRRLLLAAASLALLGACAAPNPKADAPLALAAVDLPRYMGRWYVIANVPYFGEKDYVASRVEWTLRQDGKIDDSFFGRKGSFTAEETTHQFLDTVEPDTGNAHWKVRLFFPVTVSQYTLYVDPDYRWTVLGLKDRKLAWILARDREMPEATYRELLAKLSAQGFDASTLRKVPQQPFQLGQPGFATPGS